MVIPSRIDGATTSLDVDRGCQFAAHPIVPGHVGQKALITPKIADRAFALKRGLGLSYA